MLRILTEGDDTARPPIVIAHGLFGSARNWGVIAKRLSDTRRVITVDMRNHGESHWTDSHTYPDLAEDLAQVIAAQGGQADVLGHSMGGKAAMALALIRPAHLRRLIVADIAPVAYGHTQQHLIDAMRAVDLSRIETRGDADRQLAETVAEAGVRAFLLQSLDVKGRRWRFNLDTLERFMPQILGWPDLGGRFDGPTLILSGAASDYVRPEHRPAIKALHFRSALRQDPRRGPLLHCRPPAPNSRPRSAPFSDA